MSSTLSGLFSLNWSRDIINEVKKNFKILEEKYTFFNLNLPTSIDEIKLFEKKNFGLSINVYELERKEKIRKKITNNNKKILIHFK